MDYWGRQGIYQTNASGSHRQPWSHEDSTFPCTACPEIHTQTFSALPLNAKPQRNAYLKNSLHHRLDARTHARARVAAPSVGVCCLPRNEP